MIFGHFIDFGHFPIEISIESKKFYGKWKEGSYIKKKNSFEIGEQNGTTCRYVHWTLDIVQLSYRNALGL